MENIKNTEPDGERAPLLKKWGYWYAVVVGFLVICMIVFYFLTKHFS